MTGKFKEEKKDTETNVAQCTDQMAWKKKYESSRNINDRIRLSSMIATTLSCTVRNEWRALCSVTCLVLETYFSYSGADYHHKRVR